MLPEINLNDLKKRLDQLRKLDLSIISYPEIIHIINKEIVLPILVTEVRAGNYIERIRINKGNEIFTTK